MKKHTPEEIIRLLREAEASSETAAEFCRRQGISEQTLYRWRQKYGSLDQDEAKRLKSPKSRTPSSRSCWPKPCWRMKL